MLKVKRIINDLLDENTYLVIKNNNCLIIDPGSNFEDICKSIGNLNVIGILITHYHFDHIDSLNKIKDKFNLKEKGFNNIKNNNLNMNNFNIEIIRTPGHTYDSITYYFKEDNIMFTGDFLFKDSIGRYDLPTGCFSDMINSLERIKKYDKNIIVYPGHGDSTTLGYEFNNNYYMK